MLSMCVLTLTDPLRSIDLVLLFTLFSTYIPPEDHTNKDHSISSKSRSVCVRRRRSVSYLRCLRCKYSPWPFVTTGGPHYWIDQARWGHLSLGHAARRAPGYSIDLFTLRRPCLWAYLQGLASSLWRVDCVASSFEGYDWIWALGKYNTTFDCSYGIVRLCCIRGGYKC